MKAWIQLIIMCVAIVGLGAFTTGCDSGGSNRTNRVNPNTQGVDSNLNKRINEIKEYDCNVNQTIPQINENVKVVCSNLTGLDEDKLEELEVALENLKIEATRAGDSVVRVAQMQPQNRNNVNIRQQVIKYDYLAKAVDSALDEVNQARYPVKAEDIASREKRVEKLEEFIETAKEKITTATDYDCYYEDSRSPLVECGSSLEDLVEQVRFTPSESASVVRQLELRRQAFNGFIKEVTKTIPKQVQSWHKRDNPRDSRKLYMIDVANQMIFHKVLPSRLQNDLEERTYKMVNAMVVIFGVDLEETVAEINRDLENSQDNEYSLDEIQLPFDMTDVELDLHMSLRGLTDQTLEDGGQFDVIDDSGVKSKIKKAKLENLENLEAMQVQLKSFIQRLTAVHNRYDSIRKIEGSATSGKPKVGRAVVYIKYVKFVNARLQKIADEAKRKADELKAQQPATP